MGYRTPNIDRIAQEGVSFTDYCGQQSCTAGRAAVIGGNNPLRTGMTKVGVPGAEEGWQKSDVTIATVLKSLGYATGQFGKNHLGNDEYTDGMIEHDMHVGQLLELLDYLGIADNTIVIYSTDNGPHYNTRPDAANTPYRSEKNSNWEGAYRVPAFVRWPDRLSAGVTLNGLVSHKDWLPTLAAAAGDAGI